MASISTSKDGSRRLQFADADGTRRTLSLGKTPKKQAESIKTHVERIITASISRCSVEPETATWLSKLDDVMRGKLARVGLIQARETSTLAAFLTLYIDSRNDAKATTKTVWRRTQRHLLIHFDGGRSLRSVTKADGKAFMQYLVGEGLAVNTVRRTCGIAKQFFADALDRELVDGNPFKQRDIATTTGSNQERVAYITRETVKAVLDACPDAEWRLLFALSRFAGLRTPSEPLLMKWSDIHWDQSRMTVHSPKTAHHEGGAQRVVPIFPELRPYLEAAFEAARPGEVYVITRYRGGDKNLGTQLKRIIGKAGVKPWPKVWHNLRASAETDLARVHPIKAVCDWIGNSVSVAQRHYLTTTEDDFQKAIGNPTHNPTQSPAAKCSLGQTTVPRALGKSLEHSVLPSRRVGDEGLEPTTSTV